MQKQAPTLGRILVMAIFTLSCFGLLLYLWSAFGGPVPLKPHGYRFETSFAEAVRQGQIRAVNPKVAAFAVLGQVLWIYKWFRPEGAVPAAELAREMVNLFFGGLETKGAGKGKPPVKTTKKK